MRRVVIGCIALVVLVSVCCVLFVVVLFGGTSAADPCAGPRLDRPHPEQNLDADQLHTVQVILTVVKKRSLPVRAAEVAVTASLVETELHNLNYGDRDSLGIFQQRPSQGWGTPEQIMDPVYATNKFLDALVAVPNWQALSWGEAAQKVQRSAYPERYAKRTLEAKNIVAGVMSSTGGENLDLCVDQPVNVSGAVKRALSQVGKPYCWAGGDASGPTPGDGSSPAPCGPDSPGFDCSGLMVYAYSPYTTLPRTSRMQYQAPGTVQVPVALAGPGDLLFWANDTSNPATIHHVAMVVGAFELVEAPEDGKTVQQRPYRLDSAGLMPAAVRVSL